VPGTATALGRFIVALSLSRRVIATAAIAATKQMPASQTAR
jgi:hypothetical protein